MDKLGFRRLSNIVERAMDFGYEFIDNEAIGNIEINAENFILENDEGKFEHCVLHGSDMRQYYNYYDGMMDKHVSGQIFDFGRYKKDDGIYYRKEDDGTFTAVDYHDIPQTGEERKMYIFVFDKIVNSDGDVLMLYDFFE